MYYIVVASNPGFDDEICMNEEEEVLFTNINPALELREELRGTKYATQQGWEYDVYEFDTKNLKKV